MTVAYFGNPVSIHFSMLALAGWYVEVDEAYLIGDDAERLAEMRKGRIDLCRRTSVDFGYDLKGWRELLLTFDEFGYRHPYAFKDVDMAVLDAIADPTFQRLRAEAEAQEAFADESITSGCI